jgi:uncharacterized protein YjiS (DUF1127 family)
LSIGTLVGLAGWLMAPARAPRGTTGQPRPRDWRALLELDDRMLRDIGLTRTDVIHGAEAVLARVTARHE